MNVTCYWDDPLDPDPKTMLGLWQFQWAKHGFNPVILSEVDARKHPNFKALVAKLETLPTIHSQRYRRSIFMHWLAYAQTHRSGIFCDIDVFPFGILPSNVPTGDFVCLDSERNSACVYATPIGIESFIRAILDVDPTGYHWDGRPHICDMTLCWNWYKGPTHRLCSRADFPERLTAPIVHFQNDYVRPEWRNYERWRAAKDFVHNPMLNLPDITLISIDCIHPDRTALAMRNSMHWVKFTDAVLLTDLSKFQAVNFPGLRVIHRQQGNAKVAVTPPRMVAPDYELDVIRLLADHFNTSHCLFMEWDAGVINPGAWQTSWLAWDYIGAPWPDHKDPGWPDCNQSNNVGNGGFSLRSKRFCKLCQKYADQTPGDKQLLISDAWMCRTMRPTFDSLGIRYAPEEVAQRFSCENRVYAGQFGYHGRASAYMNNWNGKWLGSVVRGTAIPL